ncbi:MAG: hypothetical protein JXA66_06665 [Oligoflexia bacterium]|nr:hypothetical protein [Oligoflexia bacterium]
MRIIVLLVSLLIPLVVVFRVKSVSTNVIFICTGLFVFVWLLYFAFRSLFRGKPEGNK